MPRKAGEGPDDPRSLNLAKIVFKLIFEPRGISVPALLDELNIKERTFRAYRQTLDSMPQFIDGDGQSLLTVTGRGEDRRLRLRTSSDMSLTGSHFALRFAALNYAKQTFGFLSGTPLGENIVSFCNDYVATCKNQTYVFSHLLRDGDRKFFYLPWAPKDYSGRSREVSAIIRALTDNRKLRVVYESKTNPAVRTVIPLTLVMWKSALFLIVQSDNRQRTYMMAVDRMIDVEVTGTTFKYPDPGTYDPARHLDGGFGVFVEPDRKSRDFEIIFKNDEGLKRTVLERRWHHTQRFEHLDDGRLKMTFTVTTEVEVWPWIRSFGDGVKVIKPNGR